MDAYEPLPDEFLREIGRATQHWNLLEMALNKILITVLGKSSDDPRSWTIFTHMAFPQKLDVLNALISAQRLPEVHPLRLFSGTVQPILKDAQRMRNKVVHSLYTVHEGKVVARSMSARGKLKVNGTPTTFPQLVKEVQKITGAVRVLDALQKALLVASSSVPQVGQ